MTFAQEGLGVKQRAFEYVTLMLLKWSHDSRGNDGNDLSTLKIMKLLFFVSLASTTLRRGNTLFDYFDNFCAMPLGPVESDIYNNIREDEFPNFRYGRTSANKKEHFSEIKIIGSVDSDCKTLIKDSIAQLKLLNENLIIMDVFDLVELSHLSSAWKNSFSKAKQQGRLSESMDREEILESNKIFSF
jgi:uncharacterized phage-associated protein